MPESTDPMTTNFMTRAEYEARHASLESRVNKLESDLGTIRQETAGKVDRIFEKIEELRTDVYKYRDTSMKTALGWMVSFLVGGGGLFGLLSVLHVLR